VTPSYSRSSDKSAAYIEVEMPGVPKESLTIEVKNDMLVIHGTRPRPATTGAPSTTSSHPEKSKVASGDVVGNGNVKVSREGGDEIEGGLRIEVDESKPVVYEVKFQLHGRSNIDAIRANYHDGLLKICVPHREETPSRSIRVTAGGD
jgi:HSP20 family molecular chaperone IbpA